MHTGATILVVDDERAVRRALGVNLEKAGYRVLLAEEGEAALQILHTETPDLVLSDLRMPRLDGMSLLEAVHSHHPNLPVVLMTGNGSVQDAVRAMRAGASDYLIKPVRKDELLLIVERALKAQRLEAEVLRLREALADRPPFEQLVGTSPAMDRVFALVDAVADADALVLVTGPTGVGKELVSRAVHQRSKRSTKPFVALNCAALPEQLLESELFGHEKGAFTGAIRRHAGRFEQASGGSLLLDEIGEIPLATQVRLLRVLESGELQRVGGSSTVKVDTRVIAATNRDLAKEVAAGRFREDLYYRLNVFEIAVPPLSARRNDIPALAEHFVGMYARRYGRPARRVSDRVLEAMMQHDWPGNVRELAHMMERAVLLTTTPIIESIDLFERSAAHVSDGADPLPSTALPLAADPFSASLPDQLRDVEARIIVEALEAAGGVQAEAARRLGISRSNLHYRVRKLGIALSGLRYTVGKA